MTLSDRTLIAIALTPIALYFAVMATVFALNPAHFPGALFGVGGAAVTPAAVGFANVLRFRRDRKPRA